MTASMNEAALTHAVIELAQTLRWKVAHFRPALTAKGHRTPVQGDGKGFPDLVLVRRQRLLFAELKVAKRTPTVEQKLWMEALRGTRGPQGEAGRSIPEVYLWTDEDWERGVIEAALR